MKYTPLLLGLGMLLSTAPLCSASFVLFEGAGASPAAITIVRDSFRTAVGGGTVAGANGSFGGVRTEINWDGVPALNSDPSPLAANFFNTTSPRGVVLSTPGTGFLVSSNAGDSVPVLFGFGNDLQAFSAQKVFSAVNSNIVDVSFFVPGTATPSTTSAFGAVFVDVEVAGGTRLEFFNASNSLLFTRDVLVGGNQGLSFLGAVANAGEAISRVRITSGTNTLVGNGVLGNPNNDFVVMDDFIYATPQAATNVSVPDSGSSSFLLVFALLGVAGVQRGLRRKAR